MGYLEFDRDHWAALRAGEPMSLAPSEMETLTSPTQPMASEEVRQILLPLSRLLHLHAAQVQSLKVCLLYTSPSPRDLSTSRMPSSA